MRDVAVLDSPYEAFSRGRLLKELHAPTTQFDTPAPATWERRSVSLGRAAVHRLGKVFNGALVPRIDHFEPFGIVAVEAMRHDCREEVRMVHLGDDDQLRRREVCGRVVNLERGRYALVPPVQLDLEAADPALPFFGRHPAGAVGAEEVVNLALDVSEVDAEAVIIEVGGAVLGPYEPDSIGHGERW